MTRRSPLDAALQSVANRVTMLRTLTVVGIGAFLVCLLLIGLRIATPGRLPGGLTTVVVAFLVPCGLMMLGFARDLWDRLGPWHRVALGTARRIEARFPDLNARLLTAVHEEARLRPGAVVGYLPAAVIREALEHHARHDWNRVVSGRRLWSTWALVLGLVVGLMGLAGSFPRAGEGGPGARVASTGTASPLDVTVEPGDAEVERGLPLLVVARFGKEVPASARLEMAATDPAPGAGAIPAVAMARSLEDPTFAGRVAAVERAMTYRVAFDGGASPTYKVRVFTFPEVRRVDAHLNFPSYTGLESRTLSDVRHVTAVEGTTLGLSVRLNKEVAAARLVDEKGQATPLTLVPGTAEVPQGPPGAEAEPAYAASWTLAESHRYKVELVDREGRKNKVATDLAVNVTANRPATVAMSQPARDVRVSPVEELRLQAKTEDDFGVVRHGISVTDPAGATTEVVLDADAPAARKRLADHLVAFEGLNAQPDQLLSYHFWAEDVGPDGQPRRTMGDLFFAEVRPFEEIFRQGEAPPAGSEAEQQQGAQQAQQAQKLAELQKQIIAATWTLIRRETGPDPGPGFAIDATAVRESQAAAIEQAEPMGATIRDPAAKRSLDAAVKEMRLAEGRLTEAVNGEDPAKLSPALAAEQAAYQALLKLRAREFEVSRRRQRQQGGGGGSASQQQLNELELSDDENRYEQQKSAKARREAASKADTERRETRQVLNRLAELARRQADVNERLKELQAALEAAKTPEAKAEAERQLKRLRDEEQQLLRDTDEVRERMEREENRGRMAEARPQVDQAREQVRQASEALEQGQVSQALNQGARAGRQLDDLREAMRRQSSDRFGEDVDEMRDQARKLAEQQANLTERLRRWDEQSKQSLRDPEGRQRVGADLDRQKQELDRLLDRMRQAVTEAEETEPLLAKELFEAARKANEQNIPKHLDEADQLARAGLPDEAAESSRRAAEGLDKLRDGVERAARSILGDETAALKRAQAELDDLAEQANRGLARNDQPNADRPGGGDARRPDDPNARRAAGPDGPDPNQAAPRPGEPGQEQGRRAAGSDRPTGPDEADAPRRAESGQPGAAGGEQGRRPDRAGAPEAGDQPGDRRDPGPDQPRAGAEPPGAGQSPGDRPPGGPDQRGRSSPDRERTQRRSFTNGSGPQPRPEGRRPGAGQAEQGQPGPDPTPQPGQQPGGQQPGGREPGDQPAGQQPGGQQPGGQQQGNRPGGQQPGGQQPGGQDPGQQPGGQQPGGQPGGNAPGPGGNRGGDLNQMMEGFEPASQANNRAGGRERGTPNGRGGGGPGGEVNPITGEGFRQWSDRLRDVEELLDNPELRAEAARIRDRARGARDEARRHAAPLDPAKLQGLVAEPIRELRDRVAEEIRKRESPDALVPIDRDPVPPRFADGVRRYYERLGSGR